MPKKNNVSVTTGNTYSYVPTNGDKIYTIMTSNDTSPCLVGSPATSNTITMNVSIGTGIENTTPVKVNIYSFDKNIFVYCSEIAKQINIYNSVGSLVKIINDSSDTHKIDMSRFARGCYVVSVITDKNVFTNKVVLR